MKKYLLILLVFAGLSAVAQEKPNEKPFDFNGYIQVRGISDFGNYNSFQIRRLKVWLKSTPEFSKHWSYKIQTTVTSLQQEKFFLQDVELAYKINNFSFDFGQFVPEYSLERFESDYKLPVIERAKVINSLIPDGTLGVRDIGVQINYETKNKVLCSHFGLFNGYGIKEYRFNNSGFMLTNKSAVQIPILDNKFEFGYSIMYRKAQNMTIPNVLPDTVIFSGDDFRYNFFAKFESKFIEMQAEYLTAFLNNQKSYGYYLTSAINFNKNQIVFSYEDYHDLINETKDNPFYRIGYNYYINSYKLKLSFDNYFQINGGKIENYLGSIQIQVFVK